MISCKEEDDGSFTFDWDENDPTESILNTWTEEDFLQVIMQRLHELKENEKS